MALSIRLSRGGAKKRPYYRIVVADARAPRDGRFIEKLGTYNPLLAKDSPDRVKLDADRINHWLSVGAQPSDRVLRFLDAAGIRERPARNNPNKAAPGEKAKERAEERATKAAEAEEARKAAEAAPAAEEPAAEEPAAEAPAAEEPAAEAPATEEPAAEAPAAEAAPAEDAADTADKGGSDDAATATSEAPAVDIAETAKEVDPKQDDKGEPADTADTAEKAE